MKRIVQALAALFVLLLLGLGALTVLFERIPPATIGVRQNQWFGAGIVQEDFGRGFHWGVTGLHKWHLLDMRTHFLTFSETESRTVDEASRPPLEIRTKDNNIASLDVTVTYRIKEGEGHQLVEEGLKQFYRQRVISTVEGVLREELAELTSESFTETDARLLRAEETLPLLREAMAHFHVEPESLLIRAVRFPDEYEEQLQAKQLFEQLALLEDAQLNVERQEAITEGIKKETERMEKEKIGDWNITLQNLSSDNQVAIAEIEGEARRYDQRVRAEADAAWETMVAEGRFALDKTEALRDELRNRALDTAGGRVLQAATAAANLQFEHVTLNSNDPSIPSVIAIDELVDVLVGKPTPADGGGD